MFTGDEIWIVYKNDWKYSFNKLKSQFTENIMHLIKTRHVSFVIRHKLLQVDWDVLFHPPYCHDYAQMEI